MKHTLTELKGEIDTGIIIIEDFSPSQSVTERTDRSIRKQYLNNTTD